MKTNLMPLCALALCALLSSCRTTYKYVQICTAEPVKNASAAIKTEGGFIYENDTCKVSYYFWGHGGNAGFHFYNKTDQVIHVDLSQTFFVRNGSVYDYYIPLTVTKTTSSSTFSSVSTTNGGADYAFSKALIGKTRNGATAGVKTSAALAAVLGAALYGSLTNTSTTSWGSSESVSTEKQAIISIPPKTSRFVSLYSIKEQLIYDCDLKTYPSQSARLNYSEDNSPLTFANFITYCVGDNENKQTIENKFYISEVANYAIPYITEFAPHPRSCDNVLTPEQWQIQNTYGKYLYDAYLNVDGTNKFYNTYSVQTNIKLYKTSSDFLHYVWNANYNAYVNYHIKK